MRFCILGAGGLGSVIGGYLAQAGEDVTFIGRPAHMQAIREHGLRISGVRGDHHVTQNMTAVTAPDQAEGEFDYLILLVKGKDTETALAEAEVLQPRVKAMLSLQNGIGKEERLREWIGRDRVIGASTIEGGTLLGPGEAANPITTPITAYFGELDGGITRRIEAITEAFDRAGLGARSVDDIMQVLWEKLVQIGSASGYSASVLGLRLYLQDGWVTRSGAEQFVALVKEMLAIYHALGYEPQNFYAPMSRFKEIDPLGFEEAVEYVMQMGEFLKQQFGDRRGRTSLHEDLVRGRKTEVDTIIKPFVDKAAELGIEVPTVLSTYRIIKTQDEYLDP